MGRRPERRANEVSCFLGELGEILFDFFLVGSPREVGVGLVKSDSTQGSHHRRTGEGLGKEDHVRVARVKFF